MIGPVAIPVDGAVDLVADVPAVGVVVAVLPDVDLRARRGGVPERVAVGRRLQPEGGPHAGGALELDARLPVAEGAQQGGFRSIDETGVVDAAGGVGGDREVA